MWCERDLVLYGRYCPPDDIDACLSAICPEGLGLLVPYDGDYVIKKLATAIRDGIRYDPLVAVLRSTNFSARNIEGSRLDLTDDEATRQFLCGLFGEVEPGIDMGASEASFLARVPPPRGNALGYVICSEVAIDMQVRHDKRSEQLLAQINGTAIASIRLDHAIMREVDRHAVTVTDTATAHGETVEPLLKLASNVSGSERSSFFRLDGPNRALVPRALYPPDSDHPATVDLESGSMVARAFWGRTALFGNDALQPDIDSRNALAVPVPGGPSGSGWPNLGVLLVFSPEPMRLDAHTLAWLRNVALRVALNEARRRLAIGTHSLRTLLPRFASADPDRTGFHGPYQVTRRHSELGVPADVAAASELIREVLASLSEATNSYSVTARAIVRRDGGAPSRETLVRFLAVPEDRASPEFVSIPVNEINSVVAWVARNGTVCDLHDIRDPAAFARYPGLGSHLPLGNTKHKIRAEYCYPIVVDGIVVGTINLKSPIVNAYAGITDLVASMAQLAAQAIAYQRHSVTAGISAFAQKLENQHVQAKLELALKELSRAMQAAEFPPSVSNLILSAGSRLLDRSLNTEASPTVSLLELLRSEMRVLPQSDIEIERLDAESPPRYGETAEAVRVILREVCENVVNHIGMAKGGLRIYGKPVLKASKHYYQLVIENPATGPIDRQIEVSAYCTPVWKNGEEMPHMGSYVAGTLARSLGGSIDMCCAKNRQGYYVSTRVLFPYLSETGQT